jgi:Fe-S cluster assembly protein SufD
MIQTDSHIFHSDWGMLTDPLLQSLEKRNGIEGTLLDRLRAEALKQFESMSLPTRKNEDYKYTQFRQLLKQQLVESVVPGNVDVLIAPYHQKLATTTLVFVNGNYIPHLSDALPAGIRFWTLKEALQDKNAVLLLERLTGHLQTSKMTPFEALNVSITAPAYVLMANPNAQVKEPIHLLHFSSGDTHGTSYVHPYKLFGIGEGANVHFVESFVSLDEDTASFTNSVNHIIVGNGAHVQHQRLQDESMQSYHINATRVFQGRDSVYTSLAVELGGILTRNNIEVVHKGTGLTSNLFGVFIAEGKQHTDTQSFIDHAMPHCESHELYKGILDNSARGVFNGKIIVRPDAQKTNAFQQNNTLVLSKDAIMDSKPQLEIFADDVKCSHGATIGQLDENALFYLRSRGLTAVQASAILQRAFVDEVINKCNHEQTREYLNQRLEAHYHA